LQQSLSVLPRWHKAVVAEAGEREVVAPVAPAAERLEVPVALVERQAQLAEQQRAGAPNAGTTTGSGVNSNATGQRPGGNTTNSRDNINTGSESAPLIRRADRLVIRTQKKAPRRGPLSFPQRALS
jgi:hypothetical protein